MKNFLRRLLRTLIAKAVEEIIDEVDVKRYTNTASMADEIRALRRDLDTELPAAMERAARKGAQTSGRR